MKTVFFRFDGWFFVSEDQGRLQARWLALYEKKMDKILIKRMFAPLHFIPDAIFASIAYKN